MGIGWVEGISCTRSGLEERLAGHDDGFGIEVTQWIGMGEVSSGKLEGRRCRLRSSE
jgi:hypothetical protein